VTTLPLTENVTVILNTSTWEGTIFVVTGQEVWRIKTNKELRNYKKSMANTEGESWSAWGL
jgi:hypothetical protein